MIIDYWSGLDMKIFPTNRVLETIVRVSMGYARLHFSNVVTAEIAKEAIDFLTKMYQVTDSYHSLCIDKKDIISAELEACERLLKYTVNKIDRETIGKEIAELKIALDLMP